MRPVAIILLLALSLSFYSCSEEFEPAEQIGSTPVDENPDPTDPTTNPGQQVFGQPIIKNSELYVLLTRATHNSGDQMTDIVCINFVYPFVLKKYDSAMNTIETVTMENDPQFYNYLLALQPSQPISISYPITTIDSNGALFSVNNNTELLNALKECSQAAVISYCNGVFAGPPDPQEVCSWRVPYYPGADNTYAGGIFLANEDGTLTFNYDGQNYPGTWVFLFVGSEPHMNINLEGTSATAAYWNIDREIYVHDDHIVIYSSPLNIRLEKYCGTTTTYAIGDTGPGNGIVFYDKGQYSDGWRYMEVIATDMPSVQWGCLGSLTSSASPSLSGMLNSVRIANFHDATGFYQNPSACNSANDGTVAARSALSWQSSGITDWFLPSEQEMQLIYTNLGSAGLGNFSANPYWTSTEDSATTARAINLNSGAISNQQKTSMSVKTRAIRIF